MRRRFEFTPDLSKFRKHQAGAYHKIVERILDGEDETGIVIPPRYGKSDVIRMSAIRLIVDNIVSRAFFITPNSILTSQLIDGGKVGDMGTRYGVAETVLNISMYPFERKPELPLPRFDIAAMNIQLAQLNMDFFADLVEKTIRETRRRPVVYVDEAHTGADDNSWGSCIKQWREAGAHLVVLTATPFRTDKSTIPGYRYKAVRNEPITIHRPSGEQHVLVEEGIAQYYKLEADYEVTFRQVWDEEDPPVLCRINKVPFEVTLNQIDGVTEDIKAARVLSELGARDTRRILRAVVKDMRVIQTGCTNLVRELTVRKEQSQDAAAIVFVCADDLEEEDAPNKQARDVEAVLAQIAPSLIVKRATSGDSDANTTIQSFARGQGDVLIVKYMGGVGLDIPRLKTCLDLSDVRQPTPFIQRITRICTVWEPTARPQDRIATADYIVPSDILAEALFKSLVRDAHGEAREIDLQNERLVERSGQTPLIRDTYEVTGTDRGEHFEDSDEQRASGERLDEVYDYLGVFPKLANYYSKPEIDLGAREIRRRMEGNGGPPPEPTPPPAQNGSFRNVGAELKERKQILTNVVNKLTTARLGPSYEPRHPLWQAEVKKVRVEHTKEALGEFRPVAKIVDVDDLDKVINSVRAELQERSRLGRR